MSTESSATGSVFNSLYNDNSHYGFLYSYTYDSDNSINKVHRTKANGSVSTISHSCLSTKAKITSLPNGNFAAIWIISYSLYARIFNSSGNASSGVI